MGYDSTSSPSTLDVCAVDVAPRLEAGPDVRVVVADSLGGQGTRIATVGLRRESRDTTGLSRRARSERPGTAYSGVFGNEAVRDVLPRGVRYRSTLRRSCDDEADWYPVCDCRPRAAREHSLRRLLPNPREGLRWGHDGRRRAGPLSSWRIHHPTPWAREALVKTPRYVGRWALCALALLAASCSETPSTSSVLLTVHFEPSWPLTSFEVQAGDEAGRVEVRDEVRVVVPHSLGGERIRVTVIGLSGASHYASGFVDVDMVSGVEVRAEIVLARLTCDGGCEERDAGTDAGSDTGTDAGTDPGTDAGSDTGTRPDTGTDAGPPPSPTRPRYPWNGFTTGSSQVSAGASLINHPLRPLLMWEPASGAARYQVQLTTECLSVDACAFLWPTVDATTHTTSFRPATPLSIRTTRPVGSRYYWRVRACNAGGVCSAWTEARYLDVGRSDDDFNGDGYSDALVGAPDNDNRASQDGNVYVYYGSRVGLPSTPSQTLDSPASEDFGYFGYSVSSLGDVNGDGYADAIVGAPGQDRGAINEGNAFIYYGSSAGLRALPNVTIDNPANQEHAWLGVSVSGLGDINADGYADVIVGAYSQDTGALNEGNAFIYHGSPSGLPAMPSRSLDSPINQANAEFGCAVAGLGDVNGDGYTDALIGAFELDNGAIDEGNAYVYYGSGSGLPFTPNVILDNPTNDTGGKFGDSIAGLGDVNGDGYADAIVGAYHQDRGATDEGNAFVYYGSSAGLAPMPDEALDNPTNQAAGAFGAGVAGFGDINADGYADVVVGAPAQSNGAHLEGNVFVYYGSSSGVRMAPSVTIDNPANFAFGRFGRSVGLGDFDGDGYADLNGGAHTQEHGAFDEGNAFVFDGSGHGLATTPSVTLDHPTNQVGGHFGWCVSG